MEHWLKPLVTLLAIVNPIGVVPFFIHFTSSFSGEQRTKTARVAAFTTFVVIASSALFGLHILEFFGISLASFQVGGGLLLIMSAVQMLHAEPAESKAQDVNDGADRANAGASIAVVPLTIPLLTGPAAISTVVIYAERARTVWEMGTLLGYGLIIGLATWLVLSTAERVGAFLGQTGINVMTRLMGLILAAIAVEVMSDGLVKLFPILGTGAP
jgi:multiple antibiotic resistance protein